MTSANDSCVSSFTIVMASLSRQTAVVGQLGKKKKQNQPDCKGRSKTIFADDMVLSIGNAKELSKTVRANKRAQQGYRVQDGNPNCTG